ncbi:MAG: class I SAM-dependent methyltransferase [Bacteroidetes bacterium]|nr:class I SAM-dependent methyltransferase [Bacteroidota bacterium]
MGNYYTENLSGLRLKKVYEIASPRIRQYMQAEVDFVLSRIHEGDKVLDLGCGYGRIIPDLLMKAGMVFGIDISNENINYGKRFLHGIQRCVLMEMDAGNLSFPEKIFDAVICIQNGISAFKVEPLTLVRESIRVTKPGGKVLFSTYSEKIWDARLEWFRLQAKEGLLGEIDEEKTGKGNIVCKDGFTATTFSCDQFQRLALTVGYKAEITEVDESALFCEISL